MRQKQIKGFLLDIDDTLYDYSSAHKAAILALLKQLDIKFGISYQKGLDTYNNARKMVHHLLLGTASSHSRLLYIQKMLELLKISVIQYALPLETIYWNEYLKNMRLFEGVHDFIKKNQDSICFLTDLTTSIQLQKLHALKLDCFSCQLVCSEEVGHEKPHPLMFNIALEKLNLKTQDVIMVGDNYSKDIIGAAALNIDSFWLSQDSLPNLTFQSNAKIKQIHSFSEINNCL